MALDEWKIYSVASSGVCRCRRPDALWAGAGAGAGGAGGAGESRAPRWQTNLKGNPMGGLWVGMARELGLEVRVAQVTAG